MSTSTFHHHVRSPRKLIEDAKHVVAIASESEDEGLEKAIEIIRRHIAIPGTCAHPTKTLSKAKASTNEVLITIIDKIEAHKGNPDIPF
jgi:hypothetical protein